ncbi:MAG: DsrE family protein [Pseudomonadota bacterium]
MRILVIAAVLFYAPATIAGEDAFKNGPLFKDFGPVAEINGATPVPAETKFYVSFDTRQQADSGDANRTLTSAARFINMHAAAGVNPENIHLAVVIHGKAVKDVTAKAESNLSLVEALVAQQTRIIVCGQSAAYYDVDTADLAPGVEMALSAMTAHALLQQDGYTLNPF